MSQRIHLAWASVSLVMVGVGFGLGSLEAEPSAAAASASPAPNAPSLAGSPLATAPSRAEVTSGAPLAARRPLAQGPTTKAAAQQASPQQPPRAAPGQIVAARHVDPAHLELPPAPVYLDPDAESLIRILLRLGLDDEGSSQSPRVRQQRFVREVIQRMFYDLKEEQKTPIYVALAALLPNQQHWQNYGSTPPPALLETRRRAYELRRTPENLNLLVTLLTQVEAGTLDKRWIEELARENPDHAELQTLFAAVAPGRAAGLFAEGGLTLRERELLVDVVGRRDGAAAARLALELLRESLDVDHLVSALSYDPEGTASFLQARRGDPVWEELGAMAKLQQAYEKTETQVQTHAVVVQYWQQLSPKRYPMVLEMLADESWTPLEAEILAAVLASGDEELIASVKYLAPPELGWKLRAREDRREGTEWGVEVEVERFMQFLEEVPFRARASLEDLYRVLPQPSSRASFRLASSFQEKGDPATAKAVLQRAQEGKLTSAARAQLAAGMSLEDLNEDEIDPEEDE